MVAGMPSSCRIATLETRANRFRPRRLRRAGNRFLTLFWRRIAGSSVAVKQAVKAGAAVRSEIRRAGLRRRDVYPAFSHKKGPLSRAF